MLTQFIAQVIVQSVVLSWYHTALHPPPVHNGCQFEFLYDINSSKSVSYTISPLIAVVASLWIVVRFLTLNQGVVVPVKEMSVAVIGQVKSSHCLSTRSNARVVT